MFQSENYSGGEGWGGYCGNPICRRRQRFGRASGSQTQPRAQDLLNVPQKFQPSFANKMAIFAFVFTVVKFLESSKNNFSWKASSTYGNISGKLSIILLRLHLKLFLQYCISSEFYVHLLTSDPEMKQRLVCFKFFPCHFRFHIIFSAYETFLRANITNKNRHTSIE